MKHYFYAIKYIHGSHMANSAGEIHRFDSKFSRQQWVVAGSPYMGPNEREALRANHKLIKTAKEYNEEGLEYPIRLTI